MAGRRAVEEAGRAKISARRGAATRKRQFAPDLNRTGAAGIYRKIIENRPYIIGTTTDEATPTARLKSGAIYQWA
jgi:hypothetical protein